MYVIMRQNENYTYEPGERVRATNADFKNSNSTWSLGVSGTLLALSTLNIGVLVVRRGLRSPNLTARLMGCLAASDYLINVLDTIHSALSLNICTCDKVGSLTPLTIIYNIVHNLSSFLLVSLCMERSCWLSSRIHGRAHHPPSSAAKIIFFCGIAIGLMNIPTWLKLDYVDQEKSNYLYLQALILDWIMGVSCIGSLASIAYLLMQYSRQQSEVVPLPVAFELGVCKSVFLITTTNMLPIIVSLVLIPFWKQDCSCSQNCLPILFIMKSYAVISVIRPMMVFIRSKKLRRNLTSFLRCQSLARTAEQPVSLTNKVGSVGTVAGNACTGVTPNTPIRISTSVVHCDLPNHNISISAQTVMGSMNNLFSNENTSASGTEQSQPGARLSLLSVSWKNDQVSRVVPFDFRGSSETLHSMASVCEHRIDVHLNKNPVSSGDENAGGSLSASAELHDDKPSGLNIWMSSHHCSLGCEANLSRSSKSPRPMLHRVQQSQQCSGCRRSPALNRESVKRSRAFSDIPSMSVSVKGHPISGVPNDLCRSQSLPIICIQEDHQPEAHCSGTSLRKTSLTSSILPGHLASNIDVSCGSSCIRPIISPADRCALTIDRFGQESPHLPGAIMTPPGFPNPEFRFNLHQHHQQQRRRSTDSSDNNAPETPPSPQSGLLRSLPVDGGSSASRLPWLMERSKSKASIVDVHAETSGVYIGTLEV